jgi:hypothetical protein
LASRWDSQGKDDAAELLRHFLGNSGQDKIIDLWEAERENQAIKNALNSVQNTVTNTAKKWANQGYIYGEFYIAPKVLELIKESGYSDNWALALGTFDHYHYGRYIINQSNRTINIHIYSLIRDTYDFDIKLYPFAELHKAGIAHNFVVKGEREFVYNVSF